jgi:RNase P subunit RPR2
VGRRGVKEYRAPEALILIAADRDQKPLVCPSCACPTVDRTPERSNSEDAPGGRVTLHCTSCGRIAAYIPRMLSRASLPESPRPSHSR